MSFREQKRISFVLCAKARKQLKAGGIRFGRKPLGIKVLEAESDATGYENGHLRGEKAEYSRTHLGPTPLNKNNELRIEEFFRIQ